MDFFGHQDQARKASKRLVWLFAAAVVCIIALIYLAATVTLVATNASDQDLLNWPLLGIVAGGVVVVVGGAVLYKTSSLRSGGSAVAEMLGGRLVEIDTKDPQERVLLNVVAEMSIASGVPVPDVYVMDNEAGINAFAAGWSHSDAAIAVTRGGLEAFTRDELQGVIAHEFSHVFHGDMRLNIRLMGALFGIICVAILGRILARSGYYSGGGRSRNKNSGGIMVFGLALIAIGYIGVFFARLIQAAVSRQREFLADAAAVQYTRNPRGIGMALARIGGLTSKIESAHAEETSHMMFANGVSGLSGALATHPPLTQRIERVLPGFLKHAQQEPNLVAAAAETPVSSQFAGGAVAGLAGTTTPAKLLATVGDPQPRHVEAAQQLLKSLPLDLSVATHEPPRAPSIIYALLLDQDATERDKQMQSLAELTDDNPAIAHDTQSCHLEIRKLDPRLRLPLVELTMPALRRLPNADRVKLRKVARELALADEHLSTFEFALLKALERHIRTDNERNVRPPGRPLSLRQCAEDAGLVLSAIAHAGANGDQDEAAAAFARGRDALSLDDIRITDHQRAKPLHLDETINKLARLSPTAKRNLITACAEVAAHDGVLTAEEVDLVRALGDLWDCPVPLSVDP